MSIRTTVTSLDESVNLFAEKRMVSIGTASDGHEMFVEVVGLSYKNGKVSEKQVGEFRADELKALAKMI